MKKLALLTVAAALLLSVPAYAASIKVPVNHVSAEGIGQEMGTVTFEDAPGGGLDILVDLAGLSKGEHGMHVHENPTCAPAAGKDGKMGAALSAGGHYDPAKSGKHEGPEKAGHLGDLPFVTANDQGVAQEKLHVRNLSTADIKNRSLMIHAGGDNYSDNPPLGGGGGRIGCGVIR